MRQPEQAGPRGAGEGRAARLPVCPLNTLGAGNPRSACPKAAPQVPHRRVSAALGGFLAAPGSLKEQQMVCPSFRLPRKPVPSSVQSVPAAGTSLALPPESDVFLGLVTGEWGGGTWVHRRPPWLCTPRVSSTSLPCPSLPPSCSLTPLGNK